MTIKLSVLKTGEHIISDVKEIISEENVVGYLFDNPHSVICERNPILVENIENTETEFHITLTPWIILSAEEKIPVRPDFVATVVEPVSMLKKMYEEKINGKLENDSSSEQHNSLGGD